MDEFEVLDFKENAEQSRQYINQFVENVTDHNIKDVLVEGSITSMTNLVLANAAFFKGQWASKFDPADTIKSVFYSSPEKQNFVDMMYKKGVFNHGKFHIFMRKFIVTNYLINISSRKRTLRMSRFRNSLPWRRGWHFNDNIFTAIHPKRFRKCFKSIKS